MNLTTTKDTTLADLHSLRKEALEYEYLETTAVKFSMVPKWLSPKTRLKQLDRAILKGSDTLIPSNNDSVFYDAEDFTDAVEHWLIWCENTGGVLSTAAFANYCGVPKYSLIKIGATENKNKNKRHRELYEVYMRFKDIIEANLIEKALDGSYSANFTAMLLEKGYSDYQSDVQVQEVQKIEIVNATPKKPWRGNPKDD